MFLEDHQCGESLSFPLLKQCVLCVFPLLFFGLFSTSVFSIPTCWYSAWFSLSSSVTGECLLSLKNELN